MSKTWETLFHLSSFMKYLLVEVLPEENSHCPQYLIDSLYDLLNITLDCIQVVKDKSGNKVYSRREAYHNQTANVALEKAKENSHDSLPVKHDQKSSELLTNASLKNTVSRIPVSDSKPVYESEVQEVQYTQPPKRKIINDLALKLSSAESKSGLIRHQSVILSKNFIFLNEQVSSGDELFGSFCIPCDKCFFGPSDWGKHLNHDIQHANIQSACEEVYCTECNFVVYGTSGFAPVYLDFHNKAHTENTPAPQQKQQEGKVVDQQNYNTNFKQIKHDNFYCGMCAKKYFSVDDWIKHLKTKHNKEINKSDYGIMETSLTSDCNESNIQRTKNICRSEDTLSNISFSSKPELYNTPDESNVDSRSSSRQGERPSQKSRHKERNYVICQNFIDFNNRIHNENITESYYCRPCDSFCFQRSQWEKHCVKDRHISFMKDENFKNFYAKCDYCNLLFIGTSIPVEEYMKYHTNGHGKVPSYIIKQINNPDNCSLEEKTRTRGKREGKRVNKNSQKENNLNYREEGNSPPLSRMDTEARVPTFANNTNNSVETINPSENNWFTTSRDEEIMCTLKKMCLARKKQLVSGEPALFGGFCILCDEIIEDAFDWMDHCGKQEHCSRVGKEDQEVEFKQLNVTVFGNKLAFKDFVP